MQFNIRLDTGRVDIRAIEAQLQALDPAAVADFDVLQRTLRISTVIDEAGIAASLSRSGYPTATSSIERQPSTCCGGCGG